MNKIPAKLNPVNYDLKQEGIFVRADNKIIRIAVQEWLYAEAQGNYTKIVTVNGVFLPYLSFSAFEALLSSDYVILVHRSFLINKNKISSIEGNRLFIGKQEVSIGSHYRQAFLAALGLKDG